MTDITMRNGAICDAKFSSLIALSFEGKTVEVDCLVADLFSGCDLLIGMDVVLCLGGVNIDSLGKKMTIFLLILMVRSGLSSGNGARVKNLHYITKKVSIE